MAERASIADSSGVCNCPLLHCSARNFLSLSSTWRARRQSQGLKKQRQVIWWSLDRGERVKQLGRHLTSVHNVRIPEKEPQQENIHFVSSMARECFVGSYSFPENEVAICWLEIKQSRWITVSMLEEVLWPVQSLLDLSQSLGANHCLELVLPAGHPSGHRQITEDSDCSTCQSVYSNRVFPLEQKPYCLVHLAPCCIQLTNGLFGHAKFHLGILASPLNALSSIRRRGMASKDRATSTRTDR